MREIEPLTIWIAAAAVGIACVFALTFYALRQTQNAKKSGLIALGLVLVSAAFFLIDGGLGLGKMSSFFIGVAVALIAGTLVGRFLRRI